MICPAEDPRTLRKQIKTVQATFKNNEFNAKDQIMVFDFLTRFVEKDDNLHVFEDHEFIILPKLLSRRVERHIESFRSGAPPGGVTYWPEVVNHFLCTHVTPETIRNDVNELQNIRRQPRSNEIAYSKRSSDAAHRCGSVIDKVHKMTMFVTGLLPSIQPIVGRFQRFKNSGQLSKKELISHWQNEEHLGRARI